MNDDATGKISGPVGSYSQLPPSIEASALARLRRLGGRPQFISHEISTAETQKYLANTGIKAPFTFVDIPYRNHTDSWVLRDIPERRALREWLGMVLKKNS